MIFWFFICILKMNIHCMCTLFVGVSGCITYCLHIYECCTVIYENYKLLLTLSSAMRFSNKGPSATFRYTKYTSKVNIESMCCKLMGFLFQSVTSCYLNFSIWPAKKVNCKNYFFIVFSTPILMATTYCRFSEREVNLITGEVSAMQDLYFDFSTYLKQYYFFIWFLYFIIWFSLVFVYQINQSLSY